MCIECGDKGDMEDIIYNSDCDNCNCCECSSCGLFPYNLDNEGFSTSCPYNNPCEDCGHINYPIDCPVWPGIGGYRRNEG